MVNTLVIDGRDTVGVALVELSPGALITFADMNGQRVVTREPIPFGHKVALAPMRRGEHVIKYGASIGVAHCDIQPGDHVHVHNLKSVRGAAR
jgi:altronate dehydratase small subunit